MSLNTFISSSPYFCQPNQFSYYVLNPIASEVHLPDYDKQNNIITFINNSGNAITLISKNSPDIILDIDKTISLTPERANGYYTITTSSANANNSWLTTGNSNLPGGLLGTLSGGDFDIIRNGTSFIQLLFSGLVFNVPLSMQFNKITDLDDPSNNGDAANKLYVDEQVPKIPLIPALNVVPPGQISRGGFIINASSFVSSSFYPGYVFAPDVWPNAPVLSGEWAANPPPTYPITLDVELPNSVKLQSVSLRGRRSSDGTTNTFFTWRIDTSTNGITYTPAFNSGQSILGSNTIFRSFTPVICTFIRFIGLTGHNTAVGLSHLQYYGTLI